MFVLKYQQPEEATADVAKIYDIFKQKRTQVPAPLMELIIMMEELKQILK